MSNDHVYANKLAGHAATIAELQAENERLQHDIDATCDGLAMMSEKYMTEKINHDKTLQRAERAELLVRLMHNGKIVYMLPDAISITHGELILFWTHTNGIPNLTPEQWERLEQLERGGT